MNRFGMSSPISTARLPSVYAGDALDWYIYFEGLIIQSLQRKIEITQPQQQVNPYNNARGSVMSTKLVHRSARLYGLATVAAALLCSGSAFAAYSTPARPTAIEQASSTAFNGATFVRIAGVQCPGRGDGYFVVPNNGKQQLEIDILINALRGGLRVTLSHNPANCEVSTVGICANNTPC